MKRALFALLLVAILVGASAMAVSAGRGDTASGNKVLGINVLLNTEATDDILGDLGSHGKVVDVIPQIRAVILRAKAGELEAIRALSYVAAANPDAERKGGPVDTVSATDFANGLSTWNLDVINVTDFGFDNR